MESPDFVSPVQNPPPVLGITSNNVASFHTPSEFEARSPPPPYPPAPRQLLQLDLSSLKPDVRFNKRDVLSHSPFCTRVTRCTHCTQCTRCAPTMHTRCTHDAYDAHNAHLRVSTFKAVPVLSLFLGVIALFGRARN